MSSIWGSYLLCPEPYSIYLRGTLGLRVEEAQCTLRVMQGLKSWDPFQGGLHGYVGGCQNDGPFLDPCYNSAPNTWGTQKGTTILTTTHVEFRA